MKAIIIAGGNGTRLFPMNKICNKHHLPICDKPVIYYPLGLVMEAGIKEVVMVIKSDDYNLYFDLLGTGERLGISIQYVYQDEPLGIADALYRCKPHVKGRFLVLLGDNFFHSGNVVEILNQQIHKKSLNDEMIMFSVPCANPCVATSVVFSEDGRASGLLFKEKNNTKSVCPGLYIYGDGVFSNIERLEPSMRNELEIIDLNRMYLPNNKVCIIPLNRNTVWLDLGTTEDRILAENYVSLIEKIQGRKIACLEEIALNNGWIDKCTIRGLYRHDETSSYIDYVKDIISEA